MKKTDEIVKNSNNKGYKADFYEPIKMIEKEHFWFRSRNDLISSLIKGIKNDYSTDFKFLEIGCGTGNVLTAVSTVFKNKTVFGMDIFLDGLLYAKQYEKLSLIQADMASPPFKAEFQIIGLFDSLEHFEDDMIILKNLRKIVSDDGYLILSVPAFPSLWSYFDDIGCHYRRYCINELTDKLKQNGYIIEDSSYFMATLFPFVWLTRKIFSKKVSEGDQDQLSISNTMKELRIIPVVNGILCICLKVENILITKFKIKLPFGTSLFVVAKKIP